MLTEAIWAGMLGLAVGNYATTFVYRLPRQESAFTRHPYCDDCGAMLTPRDLFPAFSWLLLRGKCRHCGTKIPALYFWVELFCGILFIAALNLGSQEAYLPVVAACTCLVTLWALEVRMGRLHHSVLLAICALGMIYRTLMDGSFYPSLYGVFWGAGVPMLVWRLRQGRKDITGKDGKVDIPPHVGLGAAAGAWLAPQGLVVFAILWALVWLGYRAMHHSKPPLHTVPFALALCLLIVYPSIIDMTWGWVESLAK